MEDLNLDAILSDDQIAELGLGEQEDKDTQEKKTPEKENILDAEDISAEDLFGEDEPESVGNDNKEKVESEEKKPKSTKTEETSPDNLYSSIAEAMVDEGFFSDFQDEVKNCKTAADLLKLVEKQTESQLDETQKRVLEAINNGVNPSAISKAERTLKYLNGLDDTAVEDESDDGVHLREQLIYNDYLSKGFNQKKAADLTKRSFDDGTDKEDAKEALQSYKDNIQSQYDNLLKEAREEKQKAVNEENQRREELKNKILNEKTAFGDVEVNQKTRQRIYDVATKAYRKDKESGDYLTELELFEQEHPVEFLANVAYYYALTDGFKSNGAINKAAEKKVTKAGLKKLEQVINSTQRNSDGSLRFVGGHNDSYFDGDVSIDL